MRNYKIINKKDKYEGHDFSRYNDLRVYLDGDNNEFLGTLRELRIPEHRNDKIHRVEAGEENKLTLVSHKYYDTIELWWVIALVNDIDNPFELESGTILRIPARESIFGYGGVLA